MTACCHTCVSWVLLASYAVLLGVGGVGVWVSVNNFWNEEPLPPVPPPELETITTTTTTPSPYKNRHYSTNDDAGIPEEYKEYVYASLNFSRATSDARLYVLPSCVVSMMVAVMVLVGGLWSRQFFTFTFSLYNSLGTWILTLTWIIVYQTVVAENSSMSLDSVGWVVIIHVVLMLILSAQILLCVWELRRQEAGWPTINCRSLFTVEALLMTARLTLTVYTMISLSVSQIIDGYQVPHVTLYNNWYLKPGIKYPSVLTLVCVSAACYNAVATIETILSMLLGKLHNCMTTVTSLLSALCCITIAVTNSPVIVRTLISPNYIYPETMYFSIGLSVVTGLHMVACLGFPTMSRSPPKIFHKIIKRLMSAMYSLGNDMMSEQLCCATLLQKKGKVNLIFNLISSIFSLLSIIVIAVVWRSPMYRAWGSVILLCANSATLVRTLPPVVMELRFKQADNTPVNQKLMGIVLEGTALLVGATTVFILCYYGGEMFTGVVNLLFLAFQVFIIVQLVKGKSAATEFEEVESLSETEEDASQGNDNEQNPRDLLA